MTLLNAILQNDTVKVLVLDNQKTFFESIKEPNTAIAIAAIFISLAAIATSIVSIYVTIRNNKILVTPLLVFKVSDLQNNETIEYILRNSGLGTAQIKSYKIISKKEKYDSFQFILEKGIIIKVDEFYFGTLGSETFISANSEIPLLKYKTSTKNEYNSLCNILQNIDIQIEYESLYGDKKFVSTKDPL